MTVGQVDRAVGAGNIAASVHALSSLPVVDYADRFSLSTGAHATPEQWHGVQLWVPEVGGPIDPNNEAHDLVMSVFGGMSKGERNRIKVRVRTAMASQTQLEGRYLGGRPPYGYTLTDLGQHPKQPPAPSPRPSQKARP
jgi:hypothetical protein